MIHADAVAVALPALFDLREVVTVDVGVIESISVVCSFIVTCVAANEFGPEGGECIALALRELTELQTLRIQCT